MYESVANVFDEIYPHEEYRRKLANVVSDIDERSHHNPIVRILDLCCGSGRGLSLFSQSHNYDLHGVDINPVLLEKAKNHFDGAHFLLADVRHIDIGRFDDKVFDF
jgi:ubiquinone/menaquinone biosynthesis C-methylase UbiE